MAKNLINEKDRFIKIYNQKGCNIRKTCKALNIDRGTYYNWIEKDKEFGVKCKEQKEALIDDTEDKLMEEINKNNIVAIIFYLKTQGKDRGYVERQELSHEGINPIQAILQKFDLAKEDLEKMDNESIKQNKKPEEKPPQSVS